jgi:nitroreductase
MQGIAGQVVGWMRGLIANGQTAPYYPALVKAWDAGVDTVLRSAPCIVLAMAPAQARNGMVEISLALSYLELAAPLYGLGTCWAGLLQGAILSSPELKQAMGIPQNYPFFYPMMIGYAKVCYHRLPQRKEPRIHWQ